MAEGKDVILEIEIQGALKVKKRFPDARRLVVAGEIGTIEHWYCSGCDKYFSDAEV